MTLLRFDRQCRDRTRFEAPQRDRLAGFLAIAVSVVVDSRQRGIDFGDQLALAVARAQFDGAIGFGGGAVGKIGVVLVLVLQMLQRLARLFQNVLLPRQKLFTEILALPLIHEWFFFVGPVILQLGRHSVSLPPLRVTPRGGELIAGRCRADNWHLFAAVARDVIISNWNRSVLAAGSCRKSLSGGIAWRSRPAPADRFLPAPDRVPG